MGKDILVILMIAFGLFSIIMFILFFVYLKKYYNSKHLEDDYKKEIDMDDDHDDIPFEDALPKEDITEEIKEEPKQAISFQEANNNIQEVRVPYENDPNIEDDLEFVPIKKK